MKCVYWVSYRFRLPGGADGYGGTDVVVDDGPLRPDHIPILKNFLVGLVKPATNVGIVAFSKFE